MKRGLLFIIVLLVVIIAIFASVFWFSGFGVETSGKTTTGTITGGAITGEAIKGMGGNLEAYYSFDGDALDSSGNNKNGAISGADCNCNAPGKFGNACSFNGNSYVKILKIPVSTKNTVSFWMYWNGGTGQNVFNFRTSDSIGYAFVIKSQECAGFSVDNSNVYGFDASGLKNKWVYVSLVFYNGDYNSTNNKIYLNGVMKNLGKCAGSSTKRQTGKASTEAYVGSRSATSGNNFNGRVDELSIYSRALTQEEITNLFEGNCYFDNPDMNYRTPHNLFNHNNHALLCYNHNSYLCNYDDSHPDMINVEDGKQIGSWQCDLSQKKWIDIVPRFLRDSDYCNYKGNCGPFIVTSDIRGSFAYEFWWVYYLKNGSVVNYCANFPENENCKIPVNNQGDRTVYANMSGSNNLPYSLSQVIQDSSGEIVEGVELKVVVRSNNYRSDWVSRKIPINYSTCQQECDYKNQIRCNSTFSEYMQKCGNYDNDVCLEWSSITACAEGLICSNGKCIVGANVDSCTNEGGFCSSSSLRNSIELTATCSDSNSRCYQCDQSRNYAWDSLFLRCSRAGCLKTCGGICASSQPAGSRLNSSFDCCDDGECYFCDAGYHVDNQNQICVSNNCLGNRPNTAGTNGTSLGDRNFTTGPSLNWTYSSSSVLSACRWKCNSGYHHEENLTSGFDGCLEGMESCSSDAGCRNFSLSLSNAHGVEGACAEGYSCYDCNTGYSWNSTSSICEKPCVSGCWYDSNCLVTGYRRLSSTNTNQRVFCSASGLMETQKLEDALCTNNYECATNYCRSGKCTSLVTETNRLTSAINYLVCQIKRLFGETATC